MNRLTPPPPTLWQRLYYQVFAVRGRGPKDRDESLGALLFPDLEFGRLPQPAQTNRSTPRTVTPRRPPRKTKGGAR